MAFLVRRSASEYIAAYGGEGEVEIEPINSQVLHRPIPVNSQV
jgi:hypothetical protein